SPLTVGVKDPAVTALAVVVPTASVLLVVTSTGVTVTMLLNSLIVYSKSVATALNVTVILCRPALAFGCTKIFVNGVVTPSPAVTFAVVDHVSPELSVIEETVTADAGFVSKAIARIRQFPAIDLLGRLKMKPLPVWPFCSLLLEETC